MAEAPARAPAVASGHGVTARQRPFDLFAIAAPGLEPIVARELEALGERPRVEEGGVAWEGDARSLMRANLWLRSASRVIVRVASFEVTAFHELERHAKRLPWSEFIAPGGPVEFRVTSRKSRLYHSDAIAERLVRASGGADPSGAARPRDDDASDDHPERSAQLFVVRVVRDRMEISADSSGALLHLRGYRQAVGKAPLRETLAAALLLGARWDAATPLLDPLCGSGTIPIEGALLARRIAPGLHRNFAFMRWPGFEAATWRALISDARAAELPAAPAAIAGSDRDAGAIASARANAERAGVAGDIAFARQAVSAIRPQGPPGLVATNPPYGVRVGAAGDVRDLYASLGQVLRRYFGGWRVALYSTGPVLTSQLSVPLEEMLRTSNGGLRVMAALGEIP